MTDIVSQPSNVPFDSTLVVQPRIWPGVAIVAFILYSYFIPGEIAPRTLFHFMSIFLGLVASSVALLVWWGFFSRVPRRDRLKIIGAFILFAVVSALLMPGRQRHTLLLYGMPIVTTLWVGWLLATQTLDWPFRRVGLIILISLGWSSLDLIRVEQTEGNLLPDFRWAWEKSSDDLLKEELGGRPAEKKDVKQLAVVQPGDWPEFRGPARDSRAVGERIRTDWDANPPKELWKHRVGLGWSSFSIVGDLLFTQEQVAEQDTVVCYNADTGEQFWRFAIDDRFIDSVGGDGPRGTPTIRDGRLYAQGATGKLVCLDAASGDKIWLRDIGADAGSKPPMWGFAGSPLVVGDLVIAIPAGPNGKSVIAYKKETGEPVWNSGEALHSYSSPQLATFFGTKQILVVSDFGLESFNPDDGKVLWKYAQTLPGGNRVVQPNVIGEGEVLLGTGAGTSLGTQLIHVRKTGEKWTTEAGWNAPNLKPYYNDFVVHNGYAYGFDDLIFTCVDLSNGKTKWKGERYGHGQVLCLPEQSKLVVVTEKGKVVLLEATPEESREVGSFQGLNKRDTTWNHPVIVRGKLYVRNSKEMDCYDVSDSSSLADRKE